MANVHSPTWTGTSLPPGVCLGQVRAFPAQGTDKTSTTNLPPDISEPGLMAMMCLNDSGSTIGANKVVSRKAATKTARIRITPSGSHGSLVMGVTLASVVNNSYCWVAVAGQVGIEAGAAGITADTRIKVGAADGVAVDSASTDDFAFSHETKTSGNIAACSLICRQIGGIVAA